MTKTQNQSPFPGMDPYLEGDLWQEFHDRLANQISTQLLAVLPPRYVALLDKRYVIEDPGVDLLMAPGHRVVYPDVHVLNVVRESEVAVVEMETETATAPTVTTVSPMLEEVPLLSVEIRDVAQRRLVTVIEIFSPVNKHGSGFVHYLERRGDLFLTLTHLLEIDLLRRGERLPLSGEVPPAPYYVYLSRFTHRPHTEVWAVPLRERLPVVPVPLLPPDADVLLNLQKAVEACFALVGYQRLLDYTQPPPPPSLSPEDARWVEQQVQAVTEDHP